jgi:hypothetical protein
MDENHQRSSIRPWLVMLALAALAVAACWAYIVRSLPALHHIRAVSHLKHTALALHQFAADYGRFPDSVSAPLVAAKSKSRLDLSGHSANACFRQLIAADLIGSEQIFFAHTRFTRKPDNCFDNDRNALAPGEVGFGYLMNGRVALEDKEDSPRPHACAPLAFDGKVVSDRFFDPAIHGGKGAILQTDGSVRVVEIRASDGQMILPGGKTLLETGPDTVWGDGLTPTIATPLPKR